MSATCRRSLPACLPPRSFASLLPAGLLAGTGDYLEDDDEGAAARGDGGAAATTAQFAWQVRRRAAGLVWGAHGGLLLQGRWCVFAWDMWGDLESEPPRPLEPLPSPPPLDAPPPPSPPGAERQPACKRPRRGAACGAGPLAEGGPAAEPARQWHTPAGGARRQLAGECAWMCGWMCGWMWRVVLAGDALLGARRD